MAYRYVDDSTSGRADPQWFSIDYHFAHMARVLYALHWSPQSPSDAPSSATKQGDSTVAISRGPLSWYHSPAWPRGIEDAKGGHPRLPGDLGKLDVVVVEASAGTLYWAEKIQSQGVSCVVIDAYRIRIFRDSWQKTDKRDAADLSLALWLASRSGEMKVPKVRRPGLVVRELRRYFGHTNG